MRLVVDKLKMLQKLVTIEPVICLNVMSVTIRETIINDLFISMACKVNLEGNDSVCEAIVSGLHKEKNISSLNKAIQDKINDDLSWSLPINSVIPIIMLLFLGTFSDKHKIRNPFLNLPNLGEILSTVACTLCVYYQSQLQVEAAVVSHFVVPALFGRSLMINMAAFAYIADVSTPKMCLVRMAMLQVCLNVCKPVGTALCGLLFPTFGFSLMFVSLLLLVLSLCYGLFVVQDAKEPSELTKLQLLKDSVNLNHVKEIIKLLTTSKKGQRVNVLYILTINFIVTLVFTGEGNIFFWFLQQAFSWTNTEYAYFQATRSLANCLVLSTIVPILSNTLQLHNLTIIMICLLDKILSNIICTTITTPVGLYASVIVGALTIVVTIAIRAQSAEYATKEDMGKMQSLLSIVEGISTCMSAQIYNQGIYSLTKDTHEEAFLHLSSVLIALALMLSAWKYYTELKENEKVLTPIT